MRISIWQNSHNRRNGLNDQTCTWCYATSSWDKEIATVLEANNAIMQDLRQFWSSSTGDYSLKKSHVGLTVVFWRLLVYLRPGLSDLYCEHVGTHPVDICDIPKYSWMSVPSETCESPDFSDNSLKEYFSVAYTHLFNEGGDLMVYGGWWTSRPGCIFLSLYLCTRHKALNHGCWRTDLPLMSG